MNSEVERELYQKKAAQAFGVSLRLVQGGGKAEQPSVAARKIAPARGHSRQNPLSPEEMIVGLMIGFPEIIPQIPRELIEVFFREASLRAVALQILHDYEEYQALLLDALIQEYPDFPLSYWKSKAVEFTDSEAIPKIIQDCAYHLKARKFADQKQDLLKELEAAEKDGKAQDARMLLQRLQGVLERQRELN
jgi:hypothetical protein